MHILFFIIVLLIILIVLLSLRTKYRKFNLRSIKIGDYVYYYDRWWEVMGIRGDVNKPSKGMISGKDENGKISPNINFRDIKKFKRKK